MQINTTNFLYQVVILYTCLDDRAMMMAWMQVYNNDVVMYFYLYSAVATVA
jgi:hypothetical protein